MKIILYLFVLIPALALSQQKDYKNFDRAVKYNVEGKIDKAIKYAKKSLDKSPDWIQPQLLLASIYSKSNQIELAVECLLKVGKFNKSNFENCMEQIIELYFFNGFYSKALHYSVKLSSFINKQGRANDHIAKYISNCKFAIDAKKNPVPFNPVKFNNVNTNFAEYVNFISIDGEKLFFTRRVEYKDKPSQEDLFSFRFRDSLTIPLEFNTNFNEGAITLSPNGKICVYTACDRENSIGGCDLYYRIHNDSGWSDEYNIGENVNSKFWDTQASFSPDGMYLYFISNRDGGFGGDDIWRSKINNNRFLKAENLGSNINTKFNEMSPFLHSDNITFYFSSNGHIGMGNYDIFISRRKTNDDVWSNPTNIGYPINTHEDENSLIVANDGKTAFYSSNINSLGFEDIFIFDLPNSVQADKISSIELDVITKNAGEEVVLKNVTFSSNSYKIDISSYDELNKLIAFLIKNPDLQIEIQGHTNDIGSDHDNFILSNKRAKVVYDYLSTNIKNKITYRGYGETKPLFSNQTINGRMLNRRTSFVIQ